MIRTTGEQLATMSRIRRAVADMPYLEQEAAFRNYQNWGGWDTISTDWPAPTPPNISPKPRYGSAVNVASTTCRRYAVLTCPSDQPNAPIGRNTSHNYLINYGNTHMGQGPFRARRSKGRRSPRGRRSG